jgi:hypothetical protein
MKFATEIGAAASSSTHLMLPLSVWIPAVSEPAPDGKPSSAFASVNAAAPPAGSVVAFGSTVTAAVPGSLVQPSSGSAFRSMPASSTGGGRCAAASGPASADAVAVAVVEEEHDASVTGTKAAMAAARGSATRRECMPLLSRDASRAPHCPVCSGA